MRQVRRHRGQPDHLAVPDHQLRRRHRHLRLPGQLGEYFDFMRFYVDGVLRQEWSGETGWASYTFPISDGVHVLECGTARMPA